MAEMSKAYGTALFMLAKENGAETEYEKALDIITGAMKENPMYLDFLASPAISVKERTAAIERAFSGNLPEHIVSFMCLLCEHGRIREIRESIEEYKKLVEFSRNISTALVKSAVELTEAEKEKLIKKLEKISGHSVVLECAEDRTLMGGIVIEMDGKVMDGSLKSRLREVKDVISR